MTTAASTLRRAFSESERRRILDELFAVRREMGRLADAYNAADESKAGPMAEALDAARQRALDLCSAYQQGVPVVALSRCPLTGGVVRHSVDTFGLDGLWWDSERPVRPVEDLPPTYFAMSGALKLNGAPPSVPFLCRPGPEVPFVVPRLLAQPEVKAVVSSVGVGPHQGFPVFYFADPMPYDVLRVNTWGLADYSASDPYGAGYISRSYDVATDFDFELAPWIRRGKLLWIAPGDETLTLQSLVGRCPYLGLDGRRYPMGIRLGEIWNGVIEIA